MTVIRVVAVYADSGQELKPQPVDTVRDSAGCYSMCRWRGCETTGCRALLTPNNLRAWHWVLR